MSRQLSTFPLPTGAFLALRRNGYTTVSDLESLSAEELSKELGLGTDTTEEILTTVFPLNSIQSSQLGFTSTQRWRNEISSIIVPSSNPASQIMPPPFVLPNTQSAASLLAAIPSHTLSFLPSENSYQRQVDGSARLSFAVQPLNTLLTGGLPRGHVLEISGPPQIRKDHIALGAMHSVVAEKKHVWWVDMQNISSPRAIADYLARDEDLPAEVHDFVHYTSVHTLPELIALLHNLLDACTPLNTHHDLSSSSSGAPTSSAAPSSPPHASESSQVTSLPLPIISPSLLVLSSLSAPFTSHPSLSPSARSSVLERIKSLLVRACALSGLRVVTTTNLANKLLNADGTRGTFDTGSKAVLSPALGPGYLPPGRSYRVLVVPHSRQDGVLRLIMDIGWARPSGTSTAGAEAIREEKYIIVHGHVT